MSRSRLVKAETVDRRLLAAGSRLRARALALVHGAMRESKVDQTELASLVGVRKSAVNALLRGNGNVRIDTLAEYLGALGYEADLTAVPFGEIDAARSERRAPRHIGLTIADRDRINNPDGELTVFAVSSSDRARRAMNTVRAVKPIDGTHDIEVIGLPLVHRSVKSGSNLAAYKRRIEVTR